MQENNAKISLKEKNYPGASSLIHDLGSNVVLHQTIERIHVGKKYTDVLRGILLIKGENIILIGEQNPDFNVDEILEKVSEEEIRRLKAEKTTEQKELLKKRSQLFQLRGLEFTDLDCFDDI